MRVVFQIIFCQSVIKMNDSGCVSGSFVKIIVFTGAVCSGGQAYVIGVMDAHLCKAVLPTMGHWNPTWANE